MDETQVLKEAQRKRFCYDLIKTDENETFSEMIRPKARYVWYRHL